MQKAGNSLDDLISFAEERGSEPAATAFWNILVVDDEADVHKVTKLVLSGFQFEGKGIRFINCYSGAEAKCALRNNPDISIIILDVVMEEANSGLKLVEYIRQELNNRYTRIILRTGQPGQAPERQVILQYDINDYKSKIELTSEKLLTTVISCLRSYKDMVTIERNRRGLEKIVVAADDIFQIQSLDDFLHEIVTQMTEILSHETAYHDASIRSICAEKTDDRYLMKAVAGHLRSSLEGKEVTAVLSASATECFTIAVREKITVYDGGIYVVLFNPSNGGEYVVCIEKDTPFDEWEKDLLEIFSANVATAFENIVLNSGLEHKVYIRTSELRKAKEEIESAMHELETINERLTATNLELEQAKVVADQDMRMAINVQENVLPHTPPGSEGWEAGYFFKPMAGISGDFYDFFPDAQGSLSGIALFDVSGHGIASGLITMLAKSITYRRFRGMSTRPLSDVIDAVNDDLIAELDNVPNFLSGVMLRLSGDTVEYVNAGHPDIIVRRASGQCVFWADEEDNPKGFYLGIKSMHRPHGVSSFAVDHGEFIVAFSDGMVESSDRSGEAYGITRLIENIGLLDPSQGAQAAADCLMKKFWSFIGSEVLPDDLTLVVVKRR